MVTFKFSLAKGFVCLNTRCCHEGICRYAGHVRSADFKKVVCLQCEQGLSSQSLCLPRKKEFCFQTTRSTCLWNWNTGLHISAYPSCQPVNLPYKYPGCYSQSRQLRAVSSLLSSPPSLQFCGEPCQMINLLVSRSEVNCRTTWGSMIDSSSPHSAQSDKLCPQTLQVSSLTKPMAFGFGKFFLFWKLGLIV